MKSENRMKILFDFKKYLIENKLSIFLSIIISLIYFLLIGGLNIAKIIPSFSVLPLKAVGYYGGHNATISIDIVLGIIMALVLLIRKRKFTSIKEIAIISFWSSLFLTIAAIIIMDILFVYFAMPQFLAYLTQELLANIFGVIWFTIVFTVLSTIINGLYFKINNSKKK